MKWALVLLLLVTPPAYRGPNSLGPFRIDRSMRLTSLLAALGRPRNPQADIICFANKTSRAYLYVGRLAPDRRFAGEVMLTEFPNCMGVPVSPTRAAIRTWRTREGIGLGSTLAAVLHAYGAPTERGAQSSDAAAVVYNPGLLPVPGQREVATLLIYNSSTDMRGAQFGIVHGRVAWITLSDNE